MKLPKRFATTVAASAAMCTTVLAQTSQTQPLQTDEQQQGQQQEGQQQQTLQQNQQQAQQQDQQVAQQCVDELHQLEQRMQEEGYWLTGWGGRWGYGVDTPAGPSPQGGEPGAATVPPNAQTVPDATAPGAGAGPWGRPLWGVNAPSYQIRTLYGSAYVLALRNDQQGCTAVLSELNELYDEYVQQLQEAGVEPGEVTNWRQEMLLAAEPVQQLDSSTTNVSNITGTEIRNVEDRHLGEIDDVLLGPDGSILYVIVSRGGFLGIGENHTLVPWQALKATPGFNTFVLEVPEEVLEQSPEVDPDRIGDSEAFARQREEIDQYWQQHLRG